MMTVLKTSGGSVCKHLWASQRALGLLAASLPTGYLPVLLPTNKSMQTFNSGFSYLALIFVSLPLLPNPPALSDSEGLDLELRL